MSCHYHVFIGPYIQVFNPLRTGTRKVKSCTKQACAKHGQHSSDSFCPKCGSTIGEISIPCTERKQFDVYTEFNGKEPFYEVSGEGLKIPTDYVLYYSNISKGPGRTLYDDCVILPMDAAFVQKEMDTIATFHVKEITRLKEVFGDDMVQIKWGAIAYWS